MHAIWEVKDLLGTDVDCIGGPLSGKHFSSGSHFVAKLPIVWHLFLFQNLIRGTKPIAGLLCGLPTPLPCAQAPAPLGDDLGVGFGVQDVVLDQGGGFFGEDFGFEGLEHEDQAGVGVAGFVAAEVAFDVEDGFLPAPDASAVELPFGVLDAFGVADFVALELGALEAGGEVGVLFEVPVELSLADALPLDGRVGVLTL